MFYVHLSLAVYFGTLIIILCSKQFPWEKVREEMLEKGLHSDIADKIAQYIQLKGDIDLTERLLKDENLVKVEAAKTALDEMKVLFNKIDTPSIVPDVS